jgi:hypothetical protein
MTRAQIATQLLNEMAPKGEKLAYINNREAELLKRMGGAGVDINKTGIKSYYYDEVGQTMGGTGFQDTSSLTGGSGGGGGGSYDYIPQPTVAKKVDTAPKRGSGALTAGSLFPGYLKNFEYAALPGTNINKLRNLARKTASEKSITDLLKDVLTDPDKFDSNFKRGSQIKASYPQYVKEGILSALGFKPTSQIGGGTNAGRALLEKIGSIPGAKTLGRALPGIGTVSGIYDVGSRLSQGDYFGAGLGALSAVPFAGIPAAAAQAAYDYSRAKFARGGNTGYSDFASPSSTTASQDFSTQAVSGGSDGGSYDYIPQPTVAKIATQLLNEMAPKGEKLAYINNREAELLKRMGGAGKNINETGIKSYYYDEVGQTMGGTGFQDTSSLTGGSGDGGGGSYDYIPQPTVAELNKITTPGDGNRYVNPNKTVIETLRDSNFLSNFQRKGIDRALANQWAREVQRLAPYVVGDMDKDYYFGDLKTAADLGLKNAPTTLPGGKTDIPGTAEYLAFNTIGLPALGLQSLTNLLDKALAPPATLEGAIATRNKMQGIYDDIGRIGQLGFEDKYMNNPPPTIDGGDSQPIKLPIIAEAPSDVDGTLSDFDLYMQNLRTAQPNPFMLDPRFAAAQGGVARQAYGLGSLVRKATKAVKKVLKSDIGKAALLYGAGTYLGGMKAMGGGGDLSFMDRLRNPALLKNLVYTDDKFSPFKGIAAATALTSLLSKDEEEDEDLDQISSREDKSGLREQMATYKPFRFELQSPYRLAANGGRIGYEEGGNINPADLPMSRESLPTYEDIETGEEVEYPYENKERSSAPDIDAELFQMYLDAIGSGKIPRSTTFDQYKELMGEKASMGPERTMANEGGLMNLGGNEMDLRGGGFVPLGAKEKADDVPARLSKNEFVFTADAVRAAGGGDVDRGANLMYKTMKNLESRVG